MVTTWTDCAVEVLYHWRNPWRGFYSKNDISHGRTSQGVGAVSEEVFRPGGHHVIQEW